MQWHEAFRAAGYSYAIASRFISAIQARLRSAEAVDATFNGRRSDYWANKHFPQAVNGLKSLPKAVAAPFKAVR